MRTWCRTTYSVAGDDRNGATRGSSIGAQRKAEFAASWEGVRGQYGPGPALRGYRAEPNVANDSNTETFVAMRLGIDNWRWAGVPFYLRIGKRMSRRYSEIAIRFKHAPYAPLEDTHMEQLPPNWLVLRIQPDEGISLQFEVKRPGPVVDLAAVHMDFRYRDWFPREPNVGYETLIYDCMIGDQSCFSVPTWWRKPGASCSRRWMPGPKRRQRIFRTTPLAAMARMQPRCCYSGMAALGVPWQTAERLSLRGAKRRGCAGRPARGEGENPER